MTAHEFMFLLDVPGRHAPTDMLGALTGEVLAQVGCARGATASIVPALQAAVARAAESAQSCRVRFRADKGRLEIEVSSGAGRIWHTSQAIP